MNQNQEIINHLKQAEKNGFKDITSGKNKVAKKFKWGGLRLESKLIKKFHDKWCKENGYPIKKRVIQNGKKTKMGSQQLC